MTLLAASGSLSNGVASSLSAAASSDPTSILASLQQSSEAIGSAWLISSAILTTYSTTKFLSENDVRFTGKQGEVGHLDTISRALSSISRPALLTFYRFGGSLLLGLLVHPDFQVHSRIQHTIKYARDFFLPALFLYIANYTNSISLNMIGISLTYTSKCAIPLLTVILTVFLDGAKALPNLPSLLSLVPIAIGIAAASFTSKGSLPLAGFAAAGISALAQSALNVSSKRVMSVTGVGGPAAQRAMVAVGLILTMITTFVQQQITQSAKPVAEKKEVLPLRQQSAKALTPRYSPLPSFWLSMFALTAYHVEYSLSFMFVRSVQPITYGACDAVRRLAIILAGRWMFGSQGLPPLTRLNIAGIGIALIGALSYSITSSM